MNVQVIKTMAELALAQHVLARLPDLPGPRDVRRAAAQVFEAEGLPHRRIEEWKYSDLRSLVAEPTAGTSASDDAHAAAKARALDSALTFIFIDGVLREAPRDLPRGLTVTALAQALSRDAGLISPRLPEDLDAGARSVIALNTALASDGAVIHVTAGTKVEPAIHLVFVATGTVAVRNVIVLDESAAATIVETHVAAGDAGRHENALSNVQLARGAVLDHVVDVTTARGSSVLVNTLARLDKEATYRPFHLTIGDGVMRHQVTLAFDGEYGSFDLGAASLGSGAGHSDTTLTIDHRVPHCTSRELYKTVLDGRARGIFQGKVIVRPDAQKTDGKQMAQALMLSGDAEFDSKPELEIYADDVVCGHGSTCAELDEDLLFYLRSRGIPLVAARALLVESFIGEAIDKIVHEGVREAMMTAARHWLAAGHLNQG